MSVLVMREIWDHYPVGGNELSVALALGERATNDGSLILKDEDQLIRRSRVNRATYHTMVGRMFDRGWLEAVSLPDCHYRIPFLR